jgi:uncharacterized protein YjiS (DUF1127 family)
MFLWRMGFQHCIFKLQINATCINTIGKIMSLSEAFALSARPLPPLSRVIVSLALAVADWELRHRTRKHLAGLTSHQIKDIGLDPMTAASEAAKPFWQA